MIRPDLAVAPSMREVLRADTRDAHARLDRTIGDSLSDAGHYAGLVALLHCLHASVEPVVRSWATGYGAALGQSPSCAAAFAEDLEVLGVAPLAPLDLQALNLDERGRPSGSAGLGLLYVVAGSTVGAGVMLRAVSPLLPQRGLRAAASAEARTRWQTTRALLSAASGPQSAADARDASRAALLVFDQLNAAVGAGR